MIIGILGGMGTFATINAFRQYAEVFKAEKEWDRPRIIIDNRCTMPSRVRAILYYEKRTELLSEMTESLQNLVDMGCDKIILACNTSHVFLPDIFERLPELEGKVINIIDCCVNEIKENEIKKTILIASEGTIESGIFQKKLYEAGIECEYPLPSDYKYIRKCIEAVKQDKYSDDIKETFTSLINRQRACILGCTELPVLVEKYKDSISCPMLYDPFLIALKKIRMEYENEKNINIRCI